MSINKNMGKVEYATRVPETVKENDRKRMEMLMEQKRDLEKEIEFIQSIYSDSKMFNI